MLTPLPLVHMNAMAYSAMAMVLTGGCLIPLDRFHPRSWWDSVRDSRATVLHYLGVMPAILMKAEPSPRTRSRASASASARAWTASCTRPSRRASASRCWKPGP